MLKERSNNGVRVYTPLQFELISDLDKIYEHIISLRKISSHLFEQTSKIFRFFGKDCLTIDSPCLDLKISAIGIAVSKNRISTVFPSSIVGFAFRMYNGKVGHIALSEYPMSIESRDGIILDTDLMDKAMWSGMVDTFADESRTRICETSHISVCEILDRIDKMGLLSNVNDATEYWETRNENTLKAFNKHAISHK